MNLFIQRTILRTKKNVILLLFVFNPLTEEKKNQIRLLKVHTAITKTLKSGQFIILESTTFG